MKKRIAMLLSFVLVLSLALCACGGEKKEESLVGKWSTGINMAEAFNAEMAAADPVMGECMKLESFNLPLILELKEDGTYVMAVDPVEMETSMNKLLKDMTAGMEAYFVELFAQQGLEMDVQEVLAALGVDLDTVVKELSEELTSEEAYEQYTAEGKYKAEDGKLHMTQSMDEVIDPAVYNIYTLEGDTLRLEIGTDQVEEGMEFMFPMVLTRVK